MDIALIVDEPDVSDREYPGLEVSTLRLFLISVILERTVRNTAATIEIAYFAGVESLAPIANSKNFESRQCPADRAGMR
jgi:hypothetical protein